MRALAWPPNTGTVAACSRSATSSASVSNVYGSGSAITAVARLTSGTPASTTADCSRPSVSAASELAWKVRDHALAERGGPDRHRRPRLDLGAGAEHAARAAADEGTRPQRLVDALEQRLRGGEMIPTGEHDREVRALAAERGGGALGRFDRGRAGVCAARQRRADPGCHHATIARAGSE